jgi:protoporphyrinogen oxidase
LFEASDRVGGIIRSVSDSGYLAECGPNTLMETAPDIGALPL